MSSDIEVSSYAHARLREEFGEPEQSHGKDQLWSLSPRPDTFRIKVLLNGSPESAALWLFEPAAGSDGVLYKHIMSLEDVEDMIQEIRRRQSRAAADHHAIGAAETVD